MLHNGSSKGGVRARPKEQLSGQRVTRKRQGATHKHCSGVGDRLGRADTRAELTTSKAQGAVAGEGAGLASPTAGTGGLQPRASAVDVRLSAVPHTSDGARGTLAALNT